MRYRIDNHSAFISRVERDYEEARVVLEGIRSKTKDSVLDVSKIYESPVDVLRDLLSFVDEFDSLKNVRRKELSAQIEFDRIKNVKGYLESCERAVDGLIEAYMVLVAEIEAKSEKFQRVSLDFLNGESSVSESLDQELCESMYESDFMGLLDFLVEKKEVLGGEYSDDLKLLLEEYASVDSPIGFARFMTGGIIDTMKDGITSLFVKVSNVTQETVLELNAEIQDLISNKEKIAKRYDDLISSGL